MVTGQESENMSENATGTNGQEEPAGYSEIAKRYTVIGHDDGDASVGLGSLEIYGDRAALFSALAKAQAKYAPIKRTRTVKVKSDRGDYTFDYAPLEEVISATLPALNSEGLACLSFRADAEPGVADLHTLLTHESGAFFHVLEKLSTMGVDRQGNSYALKEQEFGSKLTYRRRYQYGCLTGSSPEVDDDGNAADGNEAAPIPKPRQEPRRTPPEPPKQAAKAAVDSMRQDLQATFKKAEDLEKFVPESAPATGSEPITEEVGAKLKAEMLRCGYNKLSATAKIREVCGAEKTRESLTMADAEKLLFALRQEQSK